MPEACATNTVHTGAATASGTNSTCITSPHIVQYPRPPRRDDGRWMAIGSMVGSLLGALVNKNTIKKAREAEKTWEDIVKKVKQRGEDEMARVDPLREKGKEAQTQISNRVDKNWQRGDIEYDYGNKLKPCIDDLIAQVCAQAKCGYTPDYYGVVSRVKADAEIAAKEALSQHCRTRTRYNIGFNCHVADAVTTAKIESIVATSSSAREAERLNKWKYDLETREKAAALVEGIHNTRDTTARNYNQHATQTKFNQYNAWTADADNSLKLAADMLASSGQNLAWLAESLRRTAEKETRDWGTVGGLLAATLVSWLTPESAAKNPADC